MSGANLDPLLIRLLPVRATLTGVVEGASVAATRATLDALAALFGEGEVRVRTVYATDRFCLATLDESAGSPEALTVVDGNVVLRLGMLVKDGVAWRSQPDGYALGTVRRDCPTGTVACGLRLVIHGGGASLTNPSATLRNAAGDPVQVMGFSTASLAGGVLGPNDYLIVDGVLGTITKSIAGTKTAAETLWNAGDFLRLRPADGWVENDVAPTIELAATAGTPFGTVSYRRPYR
jgi:hypothetical protein